MKFLGLLWSNLAAKKLRTSLTVLSIFVAFLLFGYLCAISEAFTGGVRFAGADRLFTRHKVSIIQLFPISYAQRIAKVPGVRDLVPQVWFGGVYQDPKNQLAIFATEPEKYFQVYPEFTVPAEQLRKLRETRNGMIVGRTTLDRFKWKIGERIPFTAPIWGPPEGQANWIFEIVGVYDTTKKGADTSAILFRYDYFDEARTKLKGQVNWMGVRVTDPEKAAEVAQKIDQEFENSTYETKTEPEGAAIAGFVQQIGDIGLILEAVTAAVFFTILLVVGNTMSQAVRERTEELGVLKAMGFTNGLVLGLVLAESGFIALLGGVTGLGLAYALITIGGSPMPSMLPIFYLPERDLLYGALFVLGLGFVSGILPAWQASRLQIAEALRRNA